MVTARRPDVEAGRHRWRARYDAAVDSGRVPQRDFTTLSGTPLDPVYAPRPGDENEDFERIGWPGEYP
ncbi:MAG: methylmalonyl-CoA mutase, partial [Candidatus Dormibacteria bacterium]